MRDARKLHLFLSAGGATRSPDTRIVIGCSNGLRYSAGLPSPST
jgi:hypothetical protein